MNEDRLRGALRSQSSRREPSESSWDDIRDRAGHLHRRRRVAQSLVALVTVVAVLLGGLAVAGTFDDGTDHTVVATPSGTEGEIIAALDHRIVVMTADGDILRTIIDNVDLVGSISVTPDGKTVWFAYGKGCDDASVAPMIARVPIEGGTPKNFAFGLNPVVSPNGELVASERSNPVCNPSIDSVLVRTVEGAQRSSIGFGARSVPLSWAPDSTSLIQRDRQDGKSIVSVVMQAPTAIDSFRTALPDGTTTAVFLPDGSLVARSAGKRLYEVLGDDGIRFHASGRGPDALAASATGDRLLLHFADGMLQVQQGNGVPRTIATRVQGAAWLPTTSP